jgi:hypothetical protein
VFSDADVAYIRENFVTLDELLADRDETPERVHELIRSRVLPLPSYTLDDGIEYFPANYFTFPDSAGRPDEHEPAFWARYERAVAVAGVQHDPGDWDAYLSGVYSTCLREVTPETIVDKERLIRRIEALLQAPRPDDSGWRRSLRESVDELDELERPFCDFDRERAGGTVTRDRFITTPRQRYPDVFAAALR